MPLATRRLFLLEFNHFDDRSGGRFVSINLFNPAAQASPRRNGEARAA